MQIRAIRCVCKLQFVRHFLCDHAFGSKQPDDKIISFEITGCQARFVSNSQYFFFADHFVFSPGTQRFHRVINRLVFALLSSVA